MNISMISGITPLHITMLSKDQVGTDILVRFGANPKLLVRSTLDFWMGN